jgi:aminopeptidase YwaD
MLDSFNSPKVAYLRGWQSALYDFRLPNAMESEMRRVTEKASMSVLAICIVLGSAFYAAVPPIASQARQVASAVSPEKIAAHIQYLASDKLQGRRAGTPQADEAAAYIAKEFKSYGLAPGAPSGYLQPFGFVSGVKLGQENRFEIRTGSVEKALRVGVDFMPLAFSSSQPASGDAVFAGYGISAPELQYDNYSDLDVKSKIVLVLRGSPDGDNPHGKFATYTQPGLEIQNKTLKAREKGAAGIVFVSSEGNLHEDRLAHLRHDLNFLDAGIPAAVISRDATSFMLASAGLTFSDAESRAKTVATPTVLKGTSIEFKADVVKINGKGSNVVGVIVGQDPNLKRQYVIIGAHYDHLGLGGPESLAANPEGQIHHGADDNASGTSGLLELARVLAGERTSLKRSIVFIAFCGEELGLLGSAAYTKEPEFPLTSTVAMLNMDMIGRLRNDSLFVGGVGTSPEWKPLLEKLNAGNPAPPSAAAPGPSNKFQFSFGEDGFGPSDHQSFYVKDIPVLFFFTGTHDDYHKPSDTADKINAPGAARVAQLVRGVAETIASEPERLAFTKVKVEQRPTGTGFRVYLGTVPNYSDQSDGMKLDGVRPGSPAEKAGLHAGDFVIKLGKTPVKNVYDYTYALGELSPGEEVEVVIKRDGREMTLKIIPARRP